jgi:hypothetical protein
MVPHATKVPVPPTTGFLISHRVSLFYVEHVEHVLPTHHHYFLNPTGGSTHFYVEIISRTAPPKSIYQLQTICLRPPYMLRMRQLVERHTCCSFLFIFDRGKHFWLR